jgi:hypothetical protein
MKAGTNMPAFFVIFIICDSVNKLMKPELRDGLARTLNRPLCTSVFPCFSGKRLFSGFSLFLRLSFQHENTKTFLGLHESHEDSKGTAKPRTARNHG